MGRINTMLLGFCLGGCVGVLVDVIASTAGKAVFDVPMQPWHDLYTTDILAMLFSRPAGFMATSMALCGVTGAWLGWNRGGDRLFGEVRHRPVPDDFVGRLKRIAADDLIMLGIAALNYSIGNWIVTVLFAAAAVCHGAFILWHPYGSA